MAPSHANWDIVILGLLHNIARHEPVLVAFPSLHQGLLAQGLIEWADDGWSWMWRWAVRGRYMRVRLTKRGRQIVATTPFPLRTKMACDLIVPEPIFP